MKKNGILFAFLIATGSLWAQTNLAPSAEITTTVWEFYNNGDSAANIARLRDGVKNSDDLNTGLVHPTNANGKKISFVWPSRLFKAGRFVFYSRVDCCKDRIIGSTLTFFDGDSSVHTSTISGAGSIVTISPDSTLEFNKVVLTFSGDDQNFREIEIFGTPTPPTVDSVLVTANDSSFVGDTMALMATVFGINVNQTVKWSSSDEAVATVDSTGVVTGKTAGTVTITATSTVDSTKTGTKTITVPTPTVDSVRIVGDYSIWVGGSARFSATVFGTIVVQTVKWSSSDTAVATVDSTGVVTGKTAGTVIITATSTVDSTKTDTKTITVPTPVVDSVRIAGDYYSIWVGGSARFSVAVFGTIIETVKWSSSDTAVATVDSTGVVTAVAEGTVTIEATSPC